MLNIHGEILDLLNESEYFLFCILLNYGAKSCPDNGVLLHRTGWGLNKLQATKKSLITKGFLTVEARFNPNKGEKGRESNSYIITTDLASKYCDKPTQNKLVKKQLVNNKVVNNKLDDFGVHKELLKSTIIETIKDKKDKSPKVENEKVYPPNFTQELIDCFEEFLVMRKKIKKPQKLVQSKINTVSKQIETFGAESVKIAIQTSIDNHYQGIFPKILPKSQKTEVQAQDLEAYLIQHHREKDVQYYKADGRIEKWKAQLNENLFKVSNIAKGYKNENLSPLFFFEILFMPLGGMLNGNNEERKIESFKKLFAAQSDYNKEKGDFRKIIKEAYEKIKA